MEKMRLKRSELLLHEVREKVRPHFKKKYPDCDQPADITFDRAYRKYQSAE
jgi:hypothetical protein